MSDNYGVLIKQTAQQMNRAMDTYAHQLGVTGVQLSILDFISRNAHRDVIQHDVELEFNIQRATATVLLQRMVREDLIVRTPSPNDARQKTIALTQRGTELATRAATFINHHQNAIDTHFSPEERQIFRDVLAYFKALNQ